MNLDLTLALVFYAFLVLYILRNKSKFEFHGKIFALYKTKLGLKLMDKIAKKFPRLLNLLSYVSIFVGFIGMGLIFYWLFKGTFDLLFVAGAAPAVAPVLPGIKVMPGLPVLSFMHWILAILIIAVIHEFSHGIYARLYKVKVKSSGFALFGPILAAFVEPDEKQISKKSKKVQLAVFSAGPFSNILTGFLFIAVMTFITLPLQAAVFVPDGITVNGLLDDYPMQSTNAEIPFIINQFNDHEIKDFNDFSNATLDLKPGDNAIVGTNKGEFSIVAAQNPENSSKGFIGVSNFALNRAPNEEIVSKYGSFVPPAVDWIHMLFFWLWVVSWGVGLFNLLPLGPVDGGRMLLTGLTAVMHDKKKAKKYWSIVSLVSVLLILINLAPYLWQLLLFILRPFFSF
ncbi:site-2 protease family protein [Candidatus Woesearchaeota archaeon]|jgi:Zn-dependent protease|nr:site-2 protease family protein [Candidatus Woesearchaeota archaeon]MBT5215706.1 site-2 protease family protein [Candidatus Woesearchaeota archaeon]MBT6402001.1 site-2 protease family protein [Candidatus Woesearchaeota archaeon]